MAATMSLDDTQARLASDLRGLDSLRVQAKKDPRAALKGAAQQFEAFFMQMMLKSMRSTLSQDGLFDNDQTRFYSSMLDQQMAQSFGTEGATGLAKILEEQLARSLPETFAGSLRPEPSSRSADDTGALKALDQLRVLQVQAGAQRASSVLQNIAPSAAADSSVVRNASDSLSSPEAFVERLWGPAVEAAQRTGAQPHWLLAHAALESGWGQAAPRFADGRPSHNLFGIKAGRQWAGEVVEASTTEYLNGVPQTRREAFRAYGSYEEAFADYANLLSTRSRYANVLESTSGTDFAEALQRSGYATDPMYAIKLDRIIHGKTLREALQG